MLTTLHGVLKAHLQDALDLRTGEHVGVVSLLVVLILLTEIHTTGQLADAEEISTLNQLRTQR